VAVDVEDLTVSRCPLCGGIWFDFALMERVLSLETRTLKRLLLEGGSPEMPDEEYLVCPRCSDVLLHMRSEDQPGKYYACLTCYGRWMDGHEMTRIAKRSLLVRYEWLFQRLLE